MGEGSLHPRPEGRGIRGPLRSQCNMLQKIDKNYLINDQAFPHISFDERLTLQGMPLAAPLLGQL